MSYHYRKSVYLCRAVFCKHENLVWERLDAQKKVIQTAPAWNFRCGRCGRGSLDLTHQKDVKFR